MANHWTSKYAIWRDLSVAQGREVPAEIDNTVAQNERPPRLDLTEETEENFFQSCVGGSDYNAGPDLQLIQQMLQEVSTPADDVEENKVHIEHLIEIKKKPTKKRNVAVASLLEIYGGCGDVLNGELNSLSRPEKNATRINTNATKPEKIWLQNSANMFKKKSPIPRSSDNSPIPTKSSPEKSDHEVESTIEKPSMFVPSSRANDYYNKYMEQSKIRERAHEDIWSRAERQMKEIDAKRKQNSSSPSSNGRDSINSESQTGFDLVQLPQHRHLMGEDCVVCDVLCAKKTGLIEKSKD